MQWFTLSPRALDELRATTGRLREQLGERDVGGRVNAMTDAQRIALMNDVLTLVDECEAILGRTRPEAPRRPRLPDPFAALRAARG
ncbi:MAG: hypothetical protein KF878_15970 [Planctomycetes bacterium]|nr:hypothetical protein [Planctomycetota bacterium]